MESHLHIIYRVAKKKYEKYAGRLQKGLKTGSFFKKSARNQNILVRRVEKQRLKVERIQLQLSMAALGTAAALAFSPGEALAQNPGLGPFVLQNRLENPLNPPIQVIRSAPDMFDIDGDGDLDLFIGSVDGSVRWYKNYKTELGTPNNVFNEPSSNPDYNFGVFYPQSTVAFADMDGDTDIDVVVGHGSGGCGTLAFFENNAGVFTNIPYGSSPMSNVAFNTRPNFTFNNFDGDSNIEAFMASGSTIFFLEFNGSKWVVDQARHNLDNITGPFTLTTAFYDIDGDLDLDAFIGYNNGDVKLFLNNGNLDFNLTPNTALNPLYGINFSEDPFPRFIDVDGDSDLDLIVGHAFDVYFESTIRFFENDGFNNFTERQGLTNPFGGVDTYYNASPAFGDIDGDGNLDVLIGGSYKPKFFHNNGDNTFTELSGAGNPFDFSNKYGGHPAFVDIDNDTDLDLYIGDNNYLYLYRNDGNPLAPNFNTSPLPNSLSTLVENKFGDPRYTVSFIDDDGDLDFDAYVGGRYNSSQYLMVFKNNGTPLVPNFNTYGYAPAVAGPYYVNTNKAPEVADLDHDGDTDLIIGDVGPPRLRVFLKNSSNVFSELTGTNNPLDNLNSSGILTYNLVPEIKDFDKDGDLDIFIGTYYGHIIFMKNENQPISLALTPSDLTYNQGDGPVIASPLVFPTDGDATPNANAVKALVKINGYVSGEDVLAFTNQFNIAGSWNASTGELTLKGTDTPVNYRTALQSVTYENTSGSPTPSPRTLEFSLWDSDFTTPTAVSRNLVVIPTAPVLSASSSILTYTENDPSTALIGDIVVTDSNDPNLQSATISFIGTYVNGQDILEFTNQNGITGVFTTATGVLTLTGSATVANYQAALRSIKYRNPSDNPNINSRVVQIVVNDGTEDSNLFSKTINITSVNDAPQITSTAETTATEASLYTYTPTVLDPDDLNNGTDLSWSLAGQPAGMTINSTGVVSWTPPDGITTSGAITLTVRDGGENGALPFSEVFTITVTPVNDAPQLTLNTSSISYTENDPPKLLDNTAMVTDTDASNVSFDIFVDISTNFQSGEDVLSSTPSGPVSGTFNSGIGSMTISGSGTVSQFQTVLRSVTYENTSDNPDTSTRSISIVVDDGTVQTTPQTITLTVTAVNDAPVITGAGTDLTYLGGISIIDNAIGVSDPDNANLASAQVSITTGFKTGTDLLSFTAQGSITGNYNSSTGILSLSGSGTLAEYTTVLQSVTYQNTLGLDISTRIVQFTANDGSLNSNNFTRTINVNTSDLPPALNLTTSSFTYTENDGPVSIDPGITITDDSPQITGGQVSITANFVNGDDVLGFTDQSGITGSYDGVTGVLSLSGSADAAQYETALSSLTYENTSDNPGAVTKTLEIQLDDGVNTSPAASLNIQVTPVNDPPTLAGSTSDLSYRALTGPSVVDDQITITDPDDTDLVGAVVSVASDYSSGEDVLGFTDQNGITGSFNSVTGVLSLSGTASKAGYETALRSITYDNSAPVPSATSKPVEFKISDPIAEGSPFTRIVQIASNQVVAASVNTQVDLGASITIDVISLATFTAGDIITTSITGSPTLGTASVNADGSILYIPNNNAANGATDQITYELCNELNSCGSNTITITISNSAPVINIAKTKIQPGGKAAVSLLSGISDLNGNIDLNSIKIIKDPYPSGLPATIDTGYTLIIDYSGSGFHGADHIDIEACDFSGDCSKFTVVIEVGEVNKVLVYNGVTPNNDGINDFLKILDIEFFPENELFIYNKIGKLVYSITKYDNFDPVFEGFDNDGNELPDGTYYYVIILDDENRQSGFFVLQR